MEKQKVQSNECTRKSANGRRNVRCESAQGDFDEGESWWRQSAAAGERKERDVVYDKVTQR